MSRYTNGQALTYKLRKAAYHVIISQEASWYDLPEHSKGVLITRLAEDASKVGNAPRRIGRSRIFRWL